MKRKLFAISLVLALLALQGTPQRPRPSRLLRASEAPSLSPHCVCRIRVPVHQGDTGLPDGHANGRCFGRYLAAGPAGCRHIVDTRGHHADPKGPRDAAAQSGSHDNSRYDHDSPSLLACFRSASGAEPLPGNGMSAIGTEPLRRFSPSRGGWSLYTPPHCI